MNDKQDEPGDLPKFLVFPPPLPPEDTKQDEFVKEVQALKSLHHPKLIQLLAMCSRGEPVYIVTELMSKGSLKSYIACECSDINTNALP